MSIGKLYRSRDEKFLSTVNYQLHNDSETSWWGELTLTEYMHIRDGGGYMIELQDGRRGGCSLRKRVNKAVVGVPPLYHYYFRGSGLLK